jgi:hypothetical protein
MTNFSDMEKRILDRLDLLDTKIQDICNRVGSIEQYHKDQDSRDNDNTAARQWGWERFFGIAATMGLIVTISFSLLLNQ